MNVYFIRHAKSSWNNANLSDIERPLNARGLDTAPKMAAYLVKAVNLGRVMLISSPAERALATALYFAHEIGLEDSAIVQNERLYFGSAIDYIHCLNKVPANMNSVLIFGHNPTLEELASHFNNPYTGLVPTCCVLRTEINQPLSNSIAYKDFEIKDILIPKLILNS